MPRITACSSGRSTGVGMCAWAPTDKYCDIAFVIIHRHDGAFPHVTQGDKRSAPPHHLVPLCSLHGAWAEWLSMFAFERKADVGSTQHDNGFTLDQPRAKENECSTSRQAEMGSIPIRHVKIQGATAQQPDSCNVSERGASASTRTAVGRPYALRHAIRRQGSRRDQKEELAAPGIKDGERTPERGGNQ